MRLQGEQFAYIDNVCVLEPHRRGGVASALMAASSASAQAYGASHVLAHVHVHNVAARTLYARCGFTAPRLDGAVQDLTSRATDRMRGLLLLRAPLPLPPQRRRAEPGTMGLAVTCSCGADDFGLRCVCAS
jgi:Acetyltransferase (GNAT) family